MSSTKFVTGGNTSRNAQRGMGTGREKAEVRTAGTELGLARFEEELVS